jgi:hypothetical protein
VIGNEKYTSNWIRRWREMRLSDILGYNIPKTEEELVLWNWASQWNPIVRDRTFNYLKKYIGIDIDVEYQACSRCGAFLIEGSLGKRKSIVLSDPTSGRGECDNCGAILLLT